MKPFGIPKKLIKLLFFFEDTWRSVIAEKTSDKFQAIRDFWQGDASFTS